MDVSWIPVLQKDSRARNVHASTAIEGNPLTLEQVRALEEGRELTAASDRSQREVLNYFAGLRYVEKHAAKKTLRHEDVFTLHRILAKGVMDQGEAGRYRTVAVKVGRYVPPVAADVSGLMFELLNWWNEHATDLSPVLSSAVLHYRFEAIHPFADGNGRTGRALAMWELYRRGFDTHHIFSADEYYWEDRPRYYAALDAVRRDGVDLSGWLEYCAAGLLQTLERAWLRLQAFQVQTPNKVVLRPNKSDCCNCCATKAAWPLARFGRRSKCRDKVQWTCLTRCWKPAWSKKSAARKRGAIHCETLILDSGRRKIRRMLRLQKHFQV